MTDSTDAASLADFAAGFANVRRCILCSVSPEIEQQARDGKAAGVTYRVIGKWLETVTDFQGPIGKSRLERHFQDGHTRD